MADVVSFTSIGTLNRSVRLAAIVWAGATSAGNTVVLKEPKGNPIWEGRATGSHTYIGISLPDEGLYMPNGIEVQNIDAGTLFLYFRQF